MRLKTRLGLRACRIHSCRQTTQLTRHALRRQSFQSATRVVRRSGRTCGRSPRQGPGSPPLTHKGLEQPRSRRVDWQRQGRAGYLGHRWPAKASLAEPSCTGIDAITLSSCNPWCLEGGEDSSIHDCIPDFSPLSSSVRFAAYIGSKGGLLAVASLGKFGPRASTTRNLVVLPQGSARDWWEWRI